MADTFETEPTMRASYETKTRLRALVYRSVASDDPSKDVPSGLMVAVDVHDQDEADVIDAFARRLGVTNANDLVTLGRVIDAIDAASGELPCGRAQALARRATCALKDAAAASFAVLRDYDMPPQDPRIWCDVVAKEAFGLVCEAMDDDGVAGHVMCMCTAQSRKVVSRTDGRSVRLFAVTFGGDAPDVARRIAKGIADGRAARLAADSEDIAK